jgi:hypothetical protein
VEELSSAMALRVEQSHEHIKEGIEPTERFKYH